MAIIRTKENFDGYRGSVLFKRGRGETDDAYLVEWFKSHGYIVDDPESRRDLNEFSKPELFNYCREHGIEYSVLMSKDELIDTIKRVL